MAEELDPQALRFASIEVGDSPKSLSDMSKLSEVATKATLSPNGCIFFGCTLKPVDYLFICAEHAPKSYVSTNIGDAVKHCGIKHADLKKGVVTTYCMNKLQKTTIEFGDEPINCTRCLILMSIESQ